ncbi:MAG: hypothetical protein B7Z06_10765, partial [Flavobacteriales bacterium 32-35-8]
FYEKKQKKQTINAHSFAAELSKVHLLSLQELEAIFNRMQQDNLIDFVANQDKKGYNYKVKLKTKGEYFLKKESNKGADIIVSIFVYMIFLGLTMFLVFVLNNSV